jgi:hypothetical protein
MARLEYTNPRGNASVGRRRTVKYGYQRPCALRLPVLGVVEVRALIVKRGGLHDRCTSSFRPAETHWKAAPFASNRAGTTRSIRQIGRGVRAREVRPFRPQSLRRTRDLWAPVPVDEQAPGVWVRDSFVTDIA